MLSSQIGDSLDSDVQVAGETSASQSSLLKQLSELEQGMKGAHCLCMFAAYGVSSLLVKGFVPAVLHSIRTSLPSQHFVAQLDKIRVLQQRLQSVLERLRVVEASIILLPSSHRQQN